MLFTTPIFLFVFLPITFGVFFAVGKTNRRAAAAWLALASLFFYGWWNPVYVTLLLGSIGFNYAAGFALTRRNAARVNAGPIAIVLEGGYALTASRRKAVLAGAITADLALLAYYKYAHFFVANWNAWSGSTLSLPQVILPLGISFFTFTQIAFLVDTYRGKAAEPNLIDFILFVTYFPHLIAGPILHHAEMMPQFGRPSTVRLNADSVAAGLGMFAIGLFKKLVLADNVAEFAAPVFTAAAAGVAPTGLEAWGAALAYSLQLYFDFSGYSDMAIGLSRIFNIRLPLNFNSPYRATNIIEFWRRWHMTLSRFLRDYLYISLGGNRHGTLRRYGNLFLTMLLGGLWHGAGWTFVIWGALHGAFLVINHAWRHIWRGTQVPVARAANLAGGALTFVAVTCAWVFFRADNFGAAWRILGGMAGFEGLVMPTNWQAMLGPAGSWLARHGVTFGHLDGFQGIRELLWLCPLLAIVFLLPNSQQLMAFGSPALETAIPPRRFPAWHPDWRWALACGALTAAAFAHMNRISEFLYFQF